ncbi:MAG: cell wall hydrolase [Clostridiaceae bacterium]|nr:cell wall hydrolase [Clostridiaceae bacterium]
MKVKLFVSLGIAAGLLILSVAAMANMADMPEDNVSSESIVASGAAVATGITEIMEEQQVISKEEATQEPYKSKIGSMDWSEEESYLLAKIAMAEAESEDTEGKALVMLVVLNRVWNDEFPDTIEEVIYQSGQFSPIANGRFDKVEPDADCWAALDLIMLDKWDESMGATYFESKSESTWHSEHLKFLFQHGNHYFYMDKE